MTTVIVPGAPVARPGPVREVLPRPPSLTYTGSRTRAYREWYRKYGSLANYKAYKRTRKWRAGGARHGRGDDYKHEVEKDPFGHAIKDVYRWGKNTTWGLNTGRGPGYIKPGTIIRSNEYDPYRTQKHDIIWDGTSWSRYYDKDSIHTVNSTDHFDQVDLRTRNSMGMRNTYDYYNKAGFMGTSRWHNAPRRWTKIINKRSTAHARELVPMRTTRYRRFRPGFFNRDDHY